MGWYINQNSKGDTLANTGKAAQLIADGAELLFQPPSQWEPDLVCVVHNGIFDAAAFVKDARVFTDFQDPHDARPKVWLKYAHAEALAK
jgi:hypothetical protein